ncbi:YihY/virulence factor BrkB family protein [Nocardioides pacificus]
MDHGFVASVDRWHRRHPRLSIPLAVVYKFIDDQGNYLAAAMTYYAFIAIFPLMLLGTSILGLVLEGRPGLQESLLDTALSQFPIIGDELGRPGGLQGSPRSIVIGTLIALYGAVGLGQAIQNTQNAAWAIPRNSRPNPILARVRSLGILVLVGVVLLAVSVASEVANATDIFGSSPDWWAGWALRLVNIVLVGGAFTALFRLATARNHHLLRAAPGAFAVAVMWQGLQIVGAYYATSVLVGTSAMTQTFGLVLGLMGLIYAASVVSVIGVELNVVLAKRLYPRALLTPFTDRVRLTDGDRRAYAGLAQAQRLKGFQTVSVTFAPSPLERSARAARAAEAAEAARAADAPAAEAAPRTAPLTSPPTTAPADRQAHDEPR